MPLGLAGRFEMLGNRWVSRLAESKADQSWTVQLLAQASRCYGLARLADDIRKESNRWTTTTEQ